MNILLKRGKMFVIDDTKLVKKDITIKNGLYAAVYDEFLGAVDNPKYKDMTNLQKYAAMNTFAETWLRARGFLNE